MYLTQNQVFLQIKEFLQNVDNKFLCQLPDIDEEQIKQLLTISKNKQFNDMLNKLQPIIQSIPSSKYILIDGDKEIIKYRMTVPDFNEILYNFETTKNMATEFIKNLTPEFNVSIDQLRVLISHFNYNTKIRNELKQYMDYTYSHLKYKLSTEELNVQSISKLLLNNNTALNQMNQIYEYFLKQEDLTKFVSKQTFTKQQIINKYFTILNKCAEIIKNRGIPHEDIFQAAQSQIPMLIYKSIQIIINYPNYQVVNSLIYTFQIPVAYITDEPIKVNPLIIQQQQCSPHLTIGNDKQLHWILKPSKFIVHHMNGNFLDNTIKNLLEVSITEGETFNSNQKHFFLHRFLNCEYKPNFFENCISIKEFNTQPSFYKAFISKNFNNQTQIDYELDNIYEQPMEPFDIQQFIKFIKNEINE